MATRKNTQSSRDPYLLTKPSIEQICQNMAFEEHSLLMNPTDPEYRKKVAYTVLYFAAQDTSYHLKSFCFTYGIPYETIYGWTKKYPEIANAWNRAKMWIGMRRQGSAEAKDLDGNLVKLTLHTYDQEWLDINQYHADLKNQEDDKQASVNIYLGKPDVLSSEELLLEVNQTQEH